jgi:hypothetical protein
MKEYAHTDAAHYKVTPLKGDFIKSIESIRDVHFVPTQIDLFLGMTAGLVNRINERLEQLRTSG